MKFASEVQKKAFENVVAFMQEIFGEAAQVVEDVPIVSVMVGSAAVTVSVLPAGEDQVVVTTRAIVASNCRITPELALFLLRANPRIMFGAFGLSPRGDVLLEHNLIGSTLAPEELQASVLTIARVADEFDDEIVSRWGGERAVDKVDSLARLLESHDPKEVWN